MQRFQAACTLVLAGALALSGCKFVKTEDEQKQAAAGAFNPDKLVADIWEAKVVPFLQERAGTFQEVSALATITAMAEHGLTLGVEYDIVAKQTSRLLPNIQPRVESIYEDLTETGRLMGRILLARINGDETADLQVLLQPQFSFPTP